MVKCARQSDGRGFFFGLLDFLIYLFIYFLFLFIEKKRGVQKGVQKGGPEGRVHVLSTPIIQSMTKSWGGNLLVQAALVF